VEIETERDREIQRETEGERVREMEKERAPKVSNMCVICIHGVATISRLLQIIGLLCKISSLL